MQFLRRFSEEILGVGLAVMLVGIAVVIWAGPRFEAMANYQRLGSLLPLAFGGMLVAISGFATWDEESIQGKGWAISLALGFVLVVAGTIGWWVFAPDVRG
jgi:hypothetical protein